MGITFEVGNFLFGIPDSILSFFFALLLISLEKLKMSEPRVVVRVKGKDMLFAVFDNTVSLSSIKSIDPEARGLMELSKDENGLDQLIVLDIEGERIALPRDFQLKKFLSYPITGSASLSLKEIPFWRRFLGKWILPTTIVLVTFGAFSALVFFFYKSLHKNGTINNDSLPGHPEGDINLD